MCFKSSNYNFCVAAKPYPVKIRLLLANVAFESTRYFLYTVSFMGKVAH